MTYIARHTEKADAIRPTNTNTAINAISKSIDIFVSIDRITENTKTIKLHEFEITTRKFFEKQTTTKKVV